MNLLTKRLKLNGAIGDNAFKDGCGMLVLPAAADARLQFLFVEADGTVCDVADLAVVTLEFYAAVGDANTLFDAVAVTEITACTVSNFEAGSGEHVTFPLTGVDLNQLAAGVGSGQFWMVVHGTFNSSLNGARRTYAAGPVVLKNTGAGGAGPAEPPESLYPTNAEMAALIDSLSGVSTVDPPLTGFDDERGTQWSHCYDATTGRMFCKVSAPTTADPELPHSWVGWQTFNS